MSARPVPGAAPFSADGGRTGVLACHGFTGSPVSMLPWARHLADLGHTVRLPLLPGHGTTWRELNHTRWPDWYGAVDLALDELRRHCDQVAVIGLSMGGCLALRLAQRRPADVDALVLVNPAVALRDRALLALPLLRWFVPSIGGISNDIRKPDVDEGAYTRTPLHALASQVQMWKDVRAHLADVTQPLLLFRSDIDHVVDDSSARVIVDDVSSDVVERIALHDSFHVAPLDHDAQLIFDRSATFIAQHLGVPHAR